LLEIMLERVMELFEAQAGEIFLQDVSSGVFRLVVHHGEAEQAFWEIDRFRRGEGFIGKVAETGKPLWTDDLAREPRFMRRSVVEQGFNTLVSVPLTARGRVNGVLSLAFHEKRPFAQRELGLLEAVGSGVGIAAENARLYRQARRLAVLEERERIGMDLHDGIIQSIYAVGLTLDYIRLLVGDAPAQAVDRLGVAIDGLNAIIRDIRAYILDLRPTRLQAGDLAASFERLVREFKGDSLVEVDLRIEDEAVAKLDRDSGETLFHIAQEALANVAKHAHATKVWVSLISDSQGASLQVIDNGRGFDIQRTPSALGHGMVNMAERARGIGGDYEVLSSPGEGTTITVHLPGEAELDQVEVGEDGLPKRREDSS
jgi:signal transduction histidine kinase